VLLFPVRVRLHPLGADDRQLLVEPERIPDPGSPGAGRGEALLAEELAVDERIVEHRELGPVREVHLPERNQELPQSGLKARRQGQRRHVPFLDLDRVPVDAEERVVAEVGVDRALDADLDLAELESLVVLERGFLRAQVDEEVGDQGEVGVERRGGRLRGWRRRGGGAVRRAQLAQQSGLDRLQRLGRVGRCERVGPGQRVRGRQRVSLGDRLLAGGGWRGPCSK
jgi:hypothetical protein